MSKSAISNNNNNEETAEKRFSAGIVCAAPRAHTRCLIIMHTKQHPNTADSFKNLGAHRKKTFFFSWRYLGEFHGIAQKSKSKIVIDKHNTRLTLERRQKKYFQVTNELV